MSKPEPKPAPNDPFAVLPLQSAFRNFFETLESSTSVTSGGDRVIGEFASAIAISNATDSVYQHLEQVRRRIHAEYARPGPMPDGLSVDESDDDDWTPVPSEAMKVTYLSIGGLGADPVLMAAMEAATRVVAFPLAKWNAMNAARPGANHQRWHVGESIPSDQIATLRVADRMLTLAVSRLTRKALGQDLQRTAGEHPADPLIDALSLVVVRASYVYKHVQRLENANKDGHLPPSVAALHYMTPPESASPEELLKDEVTLEEWEHLPGRWWMKDVVATIREVRAFRAAVDGAMALLPSVSALVDNPHEPPVNGWRTVAYGELRLVRGSIARGQSGDMFPSDLPRVGGDVLERLHETTEAVQARMQQLINLRESTPTLRISVTQGVSKNAPVQQGTWRRAYWFKRVIDLGTNGKSRYRTNEVNIAADSGALPAFAVRGEKGSQRYFLVEEVCKVPAMSIYKDKLLKAVQDGFDPPEKVRKKTQKK